MKIIKSDIVVVIILFGTWIFYLTYDGTTRFDLSQTITLPLLAAADFTALAALYVAGRYYTAKKGKLIKEGMHKLMAGHQTGQPQDTNESENNKS